MELLPAYLDTGMKLLNRRKILPSLNRTVAILVPVHIAGFFALYLAMIAIVQREIIQAHSDSARVFASHVIEELHPVMVTSRSTDIRTGLESLTTVHDLLHLQLYDAAGAPLTGVHSDPEVYELLSIGAQDRFDLLETKNGWNLRGLVAISVNDRCAECHRAGDVLGVAAMSYDLTPFIRSARGRVRSSLDT